MCRCNHHAHVSTIRMVRFQDQRNKTILMRIVHVLLGFFMLHDSQIWIHQRKCLKSVYLLLSWLFSMFKINKTDGMNILPSDVPKLKETKRVVEHIMKDGLPLTKEGMEDLWSTWNTTFKRREKISSCPSCKRRKFQDLKKVYDLYELKDKYNNQKKKNGNKSNKQ